MKILGIETSCDETAISLVEIGKDGVTVKVLGNTVHSQIDVHASYGGVFPTLAKREHQRNLVPVLEKTLKEAGMLAASSKKHSDISQDVITLLLREPELLETFKGFIPTLEKPDIDFISVTVGPGLEPALWVGINFARALSAVWNVPVIPCNHMEGHILTGLIYGTNGTDFRFATPKFPALSLLISGGHTQIILMDKIGSYKIAGETRDDAIGECFDKVARTLGLAYPGGPKISKLASEARRESIHSPEPLPRPMIDSDDLDFSFSGLKTAVLYLKKRSTELLQTPQALELFIKGVSREVEEAVTDVVTSKMRKAVEKFGIETIVVGGGVIANAYLREHLERLAEECGLKLLLPRTDHSTDNGLMIALAGYWNHREAVNASVPLKANGTLALGPRV